MKRIFSIIGSCLLALAIFVVLSLAARAEGEGDTFVALGQDLTAEQRQYVLTEMGLTEESLSSSRILYITNEMEHQYLDGYITPDIIGTKSLSCVKVVKTAPGSGIKVTTRNISYCTITMYKNALITAGVEDADVLVVGPTQISGTAALIGAMKAYENLTGEEIGEDRKETATEEIVVIGELSDPSSGEAAVDSTTGETISKEIAEELYSYVKAKVVSEGLTDPEKIAEVLKEAQKEYNITLTDGQMEKLKELMPSIGELDIKPEKLLEQAGDLYDKYGDTVLAKAKEVYGEVVTEEVKQSVWDAVKTFFKSVFETAREKAQNH